MSVHLYLRVSSCVCVCLRASACNRGVCCLSQLSTIILHADTVAAAAVALFLCLGVCPLQDGVAASAVMAEMCLHLASQVSAAEHSGRSVCVCAWVRGCPCWGVVWGGGGLIGSTGRQVVRVLLTRSDNTWVHSASVCACLCVSVCVCVCARNQGKTLVDCLNDLYKEYGYHCTFNSYFICKYV